jgi:hypothetical protein
MPEMFGQRTHHVIHKSESHKLHQGFSILKSESADDIRIGMPVKLDPTDDFIVTPLEVGDDQGLCIGVAIHDTDVSAFLAGSTPRNSMKTTYGDLQVTVAMRAAMIIIGGAVEEEGDDPAIGGAIIPGPVRYVGYDTTDERFPHEGVNVFMNCDPDHAAMIGWALEAADPGDVCQIALIH